MRLDFWDKVDSLALVLVYNLGVDLSCLDNHKGNILSSYLIPSHS